MQSYLKIFPRTLIAQRDDEDGYTGCMRYDFEQYGQMFYAHRTKVHLCCSSFAAMDWRLTLSELSDRLAVAHGFSNALNHYLFDVLKFDPITQWHKPFGSCYEYHFRPIYFDIGLQKISDKSL